MSSLRDRLSHLEAQASFEELHLDASLPGLLTALPQRPARQLRVWLDNGRYTPTSLAKSLQECYEQLLTNARQEALYLEDVSVLPNFGDEGRCHMELGNLHEYVAVGGTFDHLHQGHKVLLSCAAAIATRGLVVGISGDPLLREKAAASHLQSWGDRARTVAAFLALQRPDLTLRLEELSDAFGPSLRPELGALVVSAETEVGGHAVNQKRQELQRSTLQLVVVPLVIDRAGEKMSSSKLRLDHDLMDAFWQCWTRTEMKVQGTRWSQLLPALAKMAGQVLVGRSRSLCEQHLSELAMGQSRITALARCLDFLFAITGPELLNVMVSDFAMDADTENQLRRELSSRPLLSRI